MHGQGSEGANSVDVDPTMKKIVIVGGDYTMDTLRKNNIEIFTIMIHYLPFSMLQVA